MSRMEERLRRAAPADAARLTELDELCFSQPWSRRSFDAELGENPAALYLAAELAGTVIGYAGLWVVLDEGHITNVAVHPHHRRKGIGRRLMESLIQTASASGAERFTLEARPSNTAAIRLYESLGFLAVGLRKGYYDDNGEDALIMWRLPCGESYGK